VSVNQINAQATHTGLMPMSKFFRRHALMRNRNAAQSVRIERQGVEQ